MQKAKQLHKGKDSLKEAISDVQQQLAQVTKTAA